MKALVPVKRVADPNVRVPIAADGLGVDLEHVRMTLNPFDEIALEEAVLLRERGTVAEVVAVTIGNADCAETLRSAMAMGAERAIHVVTDLEIQPLAAAKALAAVAREEEVDLILMGKQAVDDEANQTGQMLAAMLDWPQATFASRVTIEDGTATVEREVDAGRETLTVDLPAVVTADLRLNMPRYPSLPNLLKARKMPIEERDADSLGVDLTLRLRTARVRAPDRERGGVRVTSAADLVRQLADQGLV